MDDTAKLMVELTEAFGPPGFEHDVCKVMKKWIGPGAEISSDRLGSFIASREGTSKKPRILIAGHMDECGFMVTGILPDGYIKFAPLGGWWAHVVLGQVVTIRTSAGKLIQGVVGAKAPHILEPSERDKVMRIDDMFIDIGVVQPKEDPEKKAKGSDKEKMPEKNIAEKMGIRIGDPIVPEVKFQVMSSGSIYMAKAWDNRIGCAIACEVMRRLIKGKVKHPNTVFAAGTVQEEVGLRGAGTTAFAVDPDVAIAVDVSVSTDNPGASNPGNPNEKLGYGPGIAVADGSCLPNPILRDLFIDTAEEQKIPFHLTALFKGGTDAGMFHRSRSGVPSLYLGIASRYIHSHNSMISRDDFDNAVKLVLAVVQKLDAKMVEKLVPKI